MRERTREEGRQELRRLFVFSEGGDDVVPADVLRDLQRESKEQTASLKSFTDDLASGLKLSEETLHSMVSQLGEVVREQVVDQLTPSISGIYENTKQMAGARQESQTEVVAHAIQGLQESLGRMFEEFQSSVSGSTQTQMDDLATRIGEAGAGLGAFAERMEAVIDGLRGHVDDTRELMGDSSKRLIEQMRGETAAQAATLTEMRDSFRQSADSSASALSGAMETIASRLETVGERLGNDAAEASDRLNTASTEALGLLMASLQEAVEEQSRMIAEGAAAAGTAAASVAQTMQSESTQAAARIRGASEDLVERVETLLGNHARVVADMQGSLGRMGEVLAQGESFVGQIASATTSIADTEGALTAATAHLAATSTSLESTGSSLLSAGAQFQEQADAISARNVEAVIKIEGLLQRSAEAASQFADMRDGIEGVFQEIESGLDRYESAVRDNVNKHLADFTSQFSTSVNALAGTVESLSGIAEELTDVYERARRVSR